MLVVVEDHVAVDLIQDESSAVLLGERHTVQRKEVTCYSTTLNIKYLTISQIPYYYLVFIYASSGQGAYSFWSSSLVHTRPVGLLGLAMMMPSTPPFSAFSIAAQTSLNEEVVPVSK